jgi:UDPglucose 6-dehydrogenase
MRKIRIGIIGIGMVGTPLMRWFIEEKKYERGKDIFCYDADPKKNYRDDVSQATIIFICVPTPSNPDGSCNFSIVESVVSQLTDRENRLDWCIVIKSTVPPGTTAYLCGKYKSKGCFLFNPEFLTEAQAWSDFIKPDRQIVAAADEESRRWLNLLINLLPIATYSSPGFFQTKEGDKKYHFHEVSSTEAELVKYSGNQFGAWKVSFFNLIYDRCRAIDADPEKVIALTVHDRRIGPAWSDPTHGDFRGYAGFCFPKDSNAIIAEDEKRLPELPGDSGVNPKVFAASIVMEKGVRYYNDILIGSQGRNVEELSVHDIEVKKILEKKSKKRKKGRKKND